MAKNDKIDWTRVADFDGIGPLSGEAILKEYARLVQVAGQLENGELAQLTGENSHAPSTYCGVSMLNNNGVNIARVLVNLDGARNKVPDQEYGFYLIGKDNGPVTLIEESREYQADEIEDRVANYGWKTLNTVGETVSPEGDITKMPKVQAEFEVAMVKGLFAAAEASQDVGPAQ